MAKLDRLGWADGIAFHCHGARIGVRVNDPAILERLREYLPSGWKQASSPVVDDLYSLRIGNDAPNATTHHYHLLYQGITRQARTLVVEEALETLEQRLYTSVAAAATNRLFLQAGVVGWRGRAILVVAPESAGITSLVAALVEAGATYYSDAYAVLDRQGRVHPLGNPLMLPEESDGRKVRVNFGKRDASVGVKPLPIGLIALTEYRPSVSWRPRTVSAGESVMMLLQRIYRHDRPDRTISTIARAVSGATMLKGKREEAEETARAILHTCSTRW